MKEVLSSTIVSHEFHNPFDRLNNLRKQVAQLKEHHVSVGVKNKFHF